MMFCTYDTMRCDAIPSVATFLLLYDTSECIGTGKRSSEQNYQEKDRRFIFIFSIPISFVDGRLDRAGSSMDMTFRSRKCSAVGVRVSVT